MRIVRDRDIISLWSWQRPGIHCDHSVPGSRREVLVMTDRTWESGTASPMLMSWPWTQAGGRWTGTCHSSGLPGWPFPICLDKGYQRGWEGQSQHSVPGQFPAEPVLLFDGFSYPLDLTSHRQREFWEAGYDDRYPQSRQSEAGDH